MSGTKGTAAAKPVATEASRGSKSRHEPEHGASFYSAPRGFEGTVAMGDVSGIAAAAITGAVGVLSALVGAFAAAHAAKITARQKQWEHQQQRRNERREVYQTAIDLLTELGWRSEFDRDFQVVRDFTRPFVRAANGVRIYGSPASVAAIDEIQEGFAKSNRAKSEREKQAAWSAICKGHDNLVIAARADVGPIGEDGLEDVPFRQGAGPPA